MGKQSDNIDFSSFDSEIKKSEDIIGEKKSFDFSSFDSTLKKKDQEKPSTPSVSTSDLAGSTSGLDGTTSVAPKKPEPQLIPAQDLLNQLNGELPRTSNQFVISPSELAIKSIDFESLFPQDLSRQDRPPLNIPTLEDVRDKELKRQSIENNIRRNALANPDLLIEAEGIDDAIFNKTLAATRDSDLAERSVESLKRLRKERGLIETETRGNLEITPDFESEKIFNQLQKANADINKRSLLLSGKTEEEAESLSKILFPEEEISKSTDLKLNIDKVKNDYISFLEVNNPEKINDIKSAARVGNFKGKRSMKFMQEALEHQALIIDTKIKNILSGGADNLTEQQIGSIESLEGQRDRLKQRFDGLIFDFPEIREEVIKEKRRQQEVDESYKQAKAKALLPGFEGDKARAEVLFQQVISPIGSVAVDLVGNFLKFGVNQVQGLSNDEISKGYAGILSDWANGFFDTEKSSSVFKKPSELKGSLFENGDLKAEKLLPKISETLFQMFALLGGGAAAGGALESVGLAAGASQKLGLVASSFVTTQNDYFEEAKSLGLSDSEANNFANSSSLITSALELINPQGFIFGKEAKKIFTKNVVKAIKDGVDLKTAIKQNSAFIGKQIIGEDAQEFGQKAGDLSVKFLFNKKNQDELFDVSVTQDELKELVLLTSIISGAGAGLGVKNKSNLEKGSLFSASQDLEKFKKFLNKPETQEQFTEEELKTVSEKVTEYKKIVDGLPKNLDVDSKIKLADLVFQKKNLNESKKDVFVDDVVTSQAGDDIQNQVEDLNNQISSVFETQQETNIEKEIPNLKLEAKKGNPEFKINDGFFSRSEIIEKLNDESFIEKVKNGEVDLSISNPPPEVSQALENSGLLTNNQLQTIKTEKDVETKETTEAKTKTEAKPVLGETPKQKLKEAVSETAFKTFVDTGDVSPEILENIAEKVKDNSDLTKNEQAVFTDKTSEVESIIKEKFPVVKEAPVTPAREEVKISKEPKKPQFVRPLSQEEQKRAALENSGNQLFVIQDAIQQKVKKGKKQPSQFAKSIRRGEITVKEAIIAIESAGIKVPEEISKLQEPKPIIGKAKIAEGFDELLTAIGGKANVVPNIFNKPSAFNALKKITEGVVEETGLQGQKLIAEVKKRLKTVLGDNFQESDIDDIAKEITDIGSVIKKTEEPIVEKKSVKKVTDKVTKESSKKSKESKPKVKKTNVKIKTAISSRLDNAKNLNSKAKKIFDDAEKINIEKQDEVIDSANNFVKETGNEKVVDLFSQDSNITEKNRSFAFASLYKAAENSHNKSLDRTLSDAERNNNAGIAARGFKRIEELSVSGGRGSAIQQKLVAQSSIGLTVKTIARVSAERNAELEKQDESLNKKRSDVVKDVKGSINKGIDEVFNNDMATLIEENKKLKDTIDSLIKIQPKGKTIEQRKKKARIRIDNALNRLKKSVGSTLTSGGLSSEAIEDVTDLIIGYVQLGSLNTSQIIRKVVSNLKTVGVNAKDEDIQNISSKIDEFNDLEADESDIEKQKIESGDKSLTNEVVEKFISQKDISDIAKDYYKSGISTSKSLTNELIDELGIDESKAKKIASVIEAAVDKKIKESLENELNKKLRIQKQLTTEEKQLRKETLNENKKLANKVIDAVQLGALNKPDFINAFSEKYDFIELTDAVVRELNTITSLINKAEEAGAVEIRNKAVLKLNNLIGDLKAKDARFYAEMIRELDFLSALSGINTQGNSMAGASLGTITNFISDSIRSGGLFSAAWRFAVLKSLSPSNLKAAISAAKDSAKTNHSKYNSISYFDFSNRANNKQGSIERQMLKGTLSYLKTVSKDKNLTDNAKAIVKTIGQSLLQGYRMTFLLMAQDTFLTSINSEYLVAKEEYIKKSKELGLKGFDTLIGNKELAKSVDKKLGFDQIKDFEKESQQELNDFYNEIVGQVDQDISDGFVLENKRASVIDARAKELFGSSFFKGWKAKLFGGKPTSKYDRYISRRVKEKLDARKEEKIYKDAVETSKDWVSMSSRNVDGLHGEFNKQIQRSFSFNEKDNMANLFFKLIGTGLIKFTRIAAVTASNVQSSIPVLGLVPTVLGVGRDAEDNLKFGWKWKQNKELMTRRLVTNAVMTGVAALMFEHMFKWDDDEDEWILDENRLIDVTAIGFDDWAKNLQSDEGRKDFAIRFRISVESEWTTWRSVKYLPQALPLIGILGGLSDNIKELNSSKKQFEFKDKNKFTRVLNVKTLFELPARSMMEGTFNSIGRSVKRIIREKDESSAAAMAVNELIFQPAKSLTQPAFIRDVFNEYKTFKGGNIKESNSFYEKMVKDYYMLDTFLRDRTDLFGNKTPKQSRFDNWRNGYLKMSETNKELGLIFKYPSLTVPYYQPPETISVKIKKFSFKVKGGFRNRTVFEGYTLDSDESKDFLIDTQKDEFKKLVLKDFKVLDDLSQVDLEKELSKLRNESISFAKEKTIDKFRDTKNIKLKE